MNDTPTPTPRTDYFTKTAYDTDIDDYVAYNKAVAFAQNLERELTAALDASTQWEAEAWRSDELLEQRDNELTAARKELVETRKDFMCLAELLDGHDATECRMNLVRLKEQRDRLAEALEQWQPIETAPKDRSFILSAHPEHGYLITRWLGAREMWDGWAIEPTHWMSLPKLTTP
jgi:hypothetical protein